MIKYRVLQITNDISACPEGAKDTAEFPELVEQIEDESDIIILNTETKETYPASEFFYQTEIQEFYVNREGG